MVWIGNLFNKIVGKTEQRGERLKEKRKKRAFYGPKDCIRRGGGERRRGTGRRGKDALA